MSDRSHRRESEPLISLSSPRRIHVVGIGGPGMSPLALLLAGLGHSVTGSDVRESDVIEQLRSAGIHVALGHSADLVHGVDVVVYSTAIPAHNVELLEAHALGLPVRHRSNLLASLAQSQDTIGIAGTHGKTTTSALLTAMLQEGKKSPSCIIGAEVRGMGIGAHVGTGDVLVLEADESDGTLEMLPLTSIVVTNVDVDHLDYFGTFEEMRDVFCEVAQRTKGHIVVNADDPHSLHLRELASSTKRVITFGQSDSADVRIRKITSTVDGLSVEVVLEGNTFTAILPLRGEHNAYNFAAALAMAHAYGVTVENAMAAAQKFSGVERRFTERGVWNGAMLVDDYAHLPAEIEAAIAAARSHPQRTGKVVAVFQPNRFHRIAAMADSYQSAFHGADHVVITDVYASGTQPIAGVTGELVVNAVRRSHRSVVWAPQRSDIVDDVASVLQPGDICISMGCGDIETFPDDLLQVRQ